MQLTAVYLFIGFVLCLPLFYGYLHRYKRWDFRRDGFFIFLTGVTWPFWLVLWGREKVRERSER